MPKISVITPVYNAEKYIKESIESILQQSFTDIELIVIDDGSTDATPQIVSTIFDSRIKFIRNTTNNGSVHCLRQAIDLSSAEIIATQDADDISMKDRLQKQFIFLEEHRNIFCVGALAVKIDENGKEIGLWKFPPENHDKIAQMLIEKKKCPIINPTSMFRKNDYYELGGYSNHPSVRASYDLELWAKAFINGKQFANLQEYLIYYRWHSQSMTQRLKYQQIAAYNKIMNAFIRKMKHGTFKKMDRSGT